MKIRDILSDFKNFRTVRFTTRFNRRLYLDLKTLSDKTGVAVPHIIEHQIELLMLKPYVQNILNDNNNPISAMPKTTPTATCGG